MSQRRLSQRRNSQRRSIQRLSIASIVNGETFMPLGPLVDQDSVQDKSSTSIAGETYAQTIEENDSSNLVEVEAYSALSESHRTALLSLASLAAGISPASTSTYYPAITLIAKDLNVSISLVNLTISAYQIFQGLAPSVTAAFSDRFGRRPAYIASLVINAAANLGLALQNNYASLMVLRCLQSIGSSGTFPLAQAMLDDLTTSDQRGKFLAYLSIGSIMGPALGPVIGGLLSQYLGWRAIFWFLLIFGGVLLIIVLIFLRETNRSIVGDGSIPPPRWNRSFFQTLRKDKLVANQQSLGKKKSGVNPLTSLRVLSDKENLIICVYGGLLFAGFTSVTSIFASQLQERYAYNQVQVGLCYLPIGIGALSSRWTVAKLLDWNFKREAKKQGLELVKNRKQDLLELDFERARLAIAFPPILATGALVIAYGWLMDYKAHLAAVLIIVFILANVVTSAMIVLSALLTDLNPGNGASLGAAINLVRCSMAAGGVAGITPLINAIGIGYAATITGFLVIGTLPAQWLVYSKGYGWRKAKAAREMENRERDKAVIAAKALS